MVEEINPKTDSMRELYHLVRPNSDFIVGKDEFSSLEIRDGGKSNGFHYFFDTKKNRLITRFILEKSITGIKTVCYVAFVFSDGKYLPRIELCKRKDNDELVKEEVTVSDQTKNISARVSLTREGNERLWQLIDYIQGIQNVDVPRGNWSAVSVEDKDLYDRVTSNSDFVNGMLDRFADPQSQQILLDADKEIVENLYASTKHIKNKKALLELDALLSDEVSEASLERWIKENDWVFGVEYIKRLDATRIGLHSDADLLVESLDGFADLIELKKASTTKLFIEDKSHPGVRYPSAELSQVIGQTIFYLHTMNEARYLLKASDGINVLKPRAKIVIGRSSLLSEAERETLRRLNDTLHGIEVLTFDEIALRAKTIVDLFSEEAASADEAKPS